MSHTSVSLGPCSAEDACMQGLNRAQMAGKLHADGNYMMGGGYVVSGDAAALVVDMHNRVGLKFTPIEDAALGMWLMAMDIRHVSAPAPSPSPSARLQWMTSSCLGAMKPGMASSIVFFRSEHGVSSAGCG